MDPLKQAIRLTRELEVSTERERQARAGLNALKRAKGSASDTVRQRLELDVSSEVLRQARLREQLERLQTRAVMVGDDVAPRFPEPGRLLGARPVTLPAAPGRGRPFP